MSAEQVIAQHPDITSAPVEALGVLSEVPQPPGSLMRGTAVFVAPVDPYVTTNIENAESYRTEQRVGEIIAGIPYVASVRQAEHFGEEDREMIDLEVTMVEGFVIPTFYVQVKSSKWGVASFFDEVGRRMRKEAEESGASIERLSGDEEYQKKKEWLAKRKLIVINGGIRNNVRVTDEYVAGKFDREMKEIVERERRMQA